MKVAWCRVIVVALSVPTASSCAPLSPARIETKKEVLNKIPPALPQQETRAVTLLVFPPETSPLYDTTQIAYTIRPYQIAYFSQHEWGETPSRMLQPLLVRTLQNTHYFRAVLKPPYSGRYTYSLRTEILELMQDFTSEPATLQLSLRVRLSNDTANRIIATKEISLREPMQQKTPYAGVMAANDATAKALQKVTEFVLEKTD
jgi:cholesterol transport system auxiliary component